MRSRLTWSRATAASGFHRAATVAADISARAAAVEARAEGRVSLAEMRGTPLPPPPLHTVTHRPSHRPPPTHVARRRSFFIQAAPPGALLFHSGPSVRRVSLVSHHRLVLHRPPSVGKVAASYSTQYSGYKQVPATSAKQTYLPAPGGGNSVAIKLAPK